MDIATGIAARHDDSAMDIATGIAARPHESSRVVPRLSPPRLVTRCRMESGGGSIRTAIQFGADSKGRRRDSGGSAVDLSQVVTRSGRTAIMKLFVEYDDECCVCVLEISFEMGVLTERLRLIPFSDRVIVAHCVLVRDRLHRRRTTPL
eukprot:COSAG03_NODE_4622_length_1488_cov_13.642189_2_plen_149_part_00